MRPPPGVAGWTAVTRYAALLRGINVGGNTKIAMTDLRRLLAGLGYDDVSTYLQSGNAVLGAPEQPTAALADEIEQRIAAELGTAIRVLVRSGAELADVMDRSPLPGGPENPSRLFVAFLSGEPDPASAREIGARSLPPDRIWVSGSEAFLWCPNGASKTVLTNSFVEKQLGVTATSRNWNTVTRLASLTAD
jgi:uncharacterized protein (DUF1697 family)